MTISIRNSMSGEAYRVVPLGEPKRERHDGRRTMPTLLACPFATLGLIGEPVEQADDGLVGLAQGEAAITLGFRKHAHVSPPAHRPACARRAAPASRSQ